MLEGLARVKVKLRGPEGMEGIELHPADRAAEIILSMVHLETHSR